MVFLKILLGIVLFCVLIGAIPLRVRIRLEDEFTVLAGIGSLVLFRTPAKKKPVNLRDFTYKKHQKRLQKERAALLKKKQKKLESSARKEQKKQQKNEENEKARQLEKRDSRRCGGDGDRSRMPDHFPILACNPEVILPALIF